MERNSRTWGSRLLNENSRTDTLNDVLDVLAKSERCLPKATWFGNIVPITLAVLKQSETFRNQPKTQCWWKACFRSNFPDSLRPLCAHRGTFQEPARISLDVARFTIWMQVDNFQRILCWRHFLRIPLGSLRIRRSPWDDLSCPTILRVQAILNCCNKFLYRRTARNDVPEAYDGYWPKSYNSCKHFKHQKNVVSGN